MSESFTNSTSCSQILFFEVILKVYFLFYHVYHAIIEKNTCYNEKFYKIFNWDGK